MHSYLDYRWQLAIWFNPRELREPYEIHFFLGAVPSSPSEWERSPSKFFETIISFTAGPTVDFRFIGGYLEAYCGNEMRDEDVIPYLRDYLSWRVKKQGNYDKIENSKLKSLKVLLRGPYKGEIPLSSN